MPVPGPYLIAAKGMLSVFPEMFSRVPVTLTPNALASFFVINLVTLQCSKVAAASSWAVICLPLTRCHDKSKMLDTGNPTCVLF